MASSRRRAPTGTPGVPLTHTTTRRSTIVPAPGVRPSPRLQPRDIDWARSLASTHQQVTGVSGSRAGLGELGMADMATNASRSAEPSRRGVGWEPQTGPDAEVRRAETTRVLVDPGVRFAMATAALVAASIVLSLARMPPEQVTAGLVVVAGCATVGMRWRWQAMVAVVAWAFLTGFTYGRYGELTFDHPDLARLGLLLVAVPSIARTLAMLHDKGST